MLVADQVAFTLKHKTLLEKTTLSVQPGEFLAMVGPNGAGKSTLLKLLSGELKANHGQIYMNGKSLTDYPQREQAQLRAILPQNSQLAFPFQVEEVVMMGRMPWRYKATGRDNALAVCTAMALAQVEALAGRVFTTLSGGEQQRVQLARVLAQLWRPEQETTAPRYLLLDEPTSALDLAHQHHVLGIAKQLAQSQVIGVLAVLHDLNLAALYADRIAILRQGQLVALGKASDVLAAQSIKATFAVDVDILQHPQHPLSPLVVAQRSQPSLPPTFIRLGDQYARERSP